MGLAGTRGFARYRERVIPFRADSGRKRDNPLSFKDLNSDQARQTVDVEQVFAAYQAARETFEHRFAGAMSWKTVRGHSYLYRKRRERWESLGPRNPETEAA